MRVVKDLLGGNKPATLELPYNQSLAADSGAVGYKGSLVKIMDFDDKDNGMFWCPASLATAMENVGGILEETVANATGEGYLPNDATYGMVRRKITPLFSSTVIEAEYTQADAAGTANYDTGATGTAASTTFTAAAITTDDYLIGGWIYFINGANAGYLHYITDSANAAGAITFGTALANSVVATDDFLCILPPTVRFCDIDGTYTGIKSEVDDGSLANAILGIDHFIKAPGVPFQRLDRVKHDGIKVSNAKFYHHFCLPNTVWSDGVATS